MNQVARDRLPTLTDLTPCILAEEVDMLAEIAMKLGESGECEPWKVAGTMRKVETLYGLKERGMVIVCEGSLVLTPLGVEWSIAFARTVLG